MYENRSHSKERELKDLIQVIRSTIESNGNRISIRALLKEYKDINGSELPFSRFGYHSPLELIREFADTFGVEIDDKHRYENDYVVYCLTNADTQHIVDLVQNQRHAEERRTEIIHPLISAFGKNNRFNNNRQKTVKPFKMVQNYANEDKGSNADINCMPTLSGQIRPNQRNVRKAVCPLPDSRVITNDEKNKVSQLMAKYPSLNLLNFETLYKLFHKKPIDYKRFDYNDLQHFLREMPDVVRLVRLSDGIRVVAVEHNSTQTNGLQKDLTNGLKNGLTNHSINGSTKTNGCKQNPSLSPNDKNEFLMILRRHPNGIPVQQFVSEYYQLLGKPFISSVWGFGSPIEMFSSLTHIFNISQNKKTLNIDEWFLRESTPELKAQRKVIPPKKTVFDQKLKDNVNAMMIKINKTSQSKQLYINEFTYAYNLCFNQTIDPKTYGCDSIKQLVMNLSKVCDFDVKEKLKGRPFIVYRNKSSFE